jgi:hypothetical protein
MKAEEGCSFVEKQRTCVSGSDREEGPPSTSTTYRTMADNDLPISTMAGCAKAKAVKRIGTVNQV